MKFPGDTHRHTIVGMTGSGKTQAGVWALSRRSYDRMPWVIVDYKGDELIARIPGLVEVDVQRKPPNKRGLYVVRPLPHQEDEITQFLWKIWEQGRTGVYLDEGYMIGRFNEAYRALLTQGRAKRVPVITLSQRPAWISPFILSESEYLQSFFLYTPPDIKRMGEFMMGANPSTLPKFHSYWFDVAERQLTMLRPVPDQENILDRFDERRPRKRFFL